MFLPSKLWSVDSGRHCALARSHTTPKISKFGGGDGGRSNSWLSQLHFFISSGCASPLSFSLLLTMPHFYPCTHKPTNQPSTPLPNPQSLQHSEAALHCSLQNGILIFVSVQLWQLPNQASSESFRGISKCILCMCCTSLHTNSWELFLQSCSSDIYTPVWSSCGIYIIQDVIPVIQKHL